MVISIRPWRLDMKTAAVSELKASLSEYLGKVKAGEEVIVTDRGRPIARIVPLGRDESEISPHLLTLERAGLARIGRGEIPPEFWRRRRPVDKQGAALAALLEERKEGR
jgi:prevent-host-death family protein